MSSGCSTQKKAEEPSTVTQSQQEETTQTQESGEAEKKTYGPTTPQKRPIVLVFGPGMARGFAYAGILRELEKNKIPVGAIVGSEMGALLGAMYADSSGLNEFEWKSLKLKEEVFVSSGMSLSRLFNKPDDGSRLSSNLETIFSNRNISDTHIPLRVSVYSKNESRNEFPLQGKVRDWIRASLAVDPVFSSVKIGGHEFRSSLPEEAFPIELAKSLKIGPVVFVNLHSDLANMSGQSDNEKKYLDKIKEALNSSRSDIAKADLILTPDLSGISYMDFKQRKKIEYRGKAEVDKYVKELKDLIYED